MDTLKIGKFIARMRKEKNMTQEDLARILGVTNKAEIIKNKPKNIKVI